MARGSQAVRDVLDPAVAAGAEVGHRGVVRVQLLQAVHQQGVADALRAEDDDAVLEADRVHAGVLAPAEGRGVHQLEVDAGALEHRHQAQVVADDDRGRQVLGQHLDAAVGVLAVRHGRSGHLGFRVDLGDDRVDHLGEVEVGHGLLGRLGHEAQRPVGQHQHDLAALLDPADRVRARVGGQSGLVLRR